jgi:hypothetical protein
LLANTNADTCVRRDWIDIQLQHIQLQRLRSSTARKRNAAASVVTFFADETVNGEDARIL